MKYDQKEQPDSECDDEFTVGTILSARHLGSAESLREACKHMPRAVSTRLLEMLDFNCNSDDDATE